MQDPLENIAEIDISKAKEMLDSCGASFVDIRDPYSYEAAHIPGARNILDHNLDDFLTRSDRKQPLVVYCYHGNTSLGAAAFFMDQGFEEVYSMGGGFETWRTIHDTESGKEPESSP